MIFSVQAFSQDGIRTMMVEKGNKLGLKTSDNSTLTIIRFDAKNRAYYLPFNDNSCIFFKDVPENTQAFATWGEIYNLYDDLIFGKAQKGKDGRITRGKPQLFIGAPTSDEFKTPQKSGAGQHFEGGSIYWSQPTGAHEVHGSIRDKWKSLGLENSFLGFPTTDETSTPDGYGRFNFFEGGAIYYHPHLGTFAVPKMIVEVWKKNGWEKGKLGYPISDEIIKNNNSIQKFEFGAVISTKGGAYQVIYNGDKKARGLYTKWLETGAENSNLGDLLVPNRNYPKNQFQYFAEFQNGYIYESFIRQANGNTPLDAFVIRKGPIFDYYAKKKWEQGSLGLPISDEIPSKKDGQEMIEQHFQNGVIYYTKSIGAFEKKN